MNWHRFDIKGFLKASKHWEEDKAKLEQEMDALLTLPSIKNESGVHSSNVSDITAQTALRRLQIQAEIEEIKLNEEMLNYALKQLTEDERALIDGFFYPRQKIGVFVEEYGRKHGMCKDYVYRDKDAALNKMRTIIETEYCE